eukprot:CAMPEP_0195054798 /NCGR_PEP_ID=MMETSP0448-20130528/3613_1 /TAXON_ID=66468 /ORGANISM="Heterocapsa triquestra, Strain CCMP 448" /LENGTH=392 /DNA_ID=CAMNT_0040084351 /DNA_START=221 /DNA_END=1399 /DNA_ORIENTATION=+
MFYNCIQQPLATDLDPSANIWSIGWLRPFVMAAPAAVCTTIVLNWFQTEGHVFEIHKDIGIVKHDRAVQIIALPAVFAVMAMASMVPILELVTNNINSEMLETPFGINVQDRVQHLFHPHGEAQLIDVSLPGNFSNQTHLRWEPAKQVALWRYETCFFVGDLFEAWALYQFGKLSLELIKENFVKQAASDVEVEQRAARDLLASHSAVTSLTWLGTITFVVVCVGQTACSLWPYIGGSTEGRENIMLQFQVAGFVASGAAIYNVFIVERAYHEHLSHASPILKFLSVKILVSLSFFQRGLLVLMQTTNRLLPEVLQKIVRYVPLVGDLANMTEVQIHLFYPSLLMFECLLSAIMHLWAWNPREAWYNDDDVEESERQPLLGKKPEKPEVQEA